MDFEKENPDLFLSSDEAFQYLRHVGRIQDRDIDLAEAALAFSLVFLPGLNVDRYRQHLKKLCGHVEEEFKSRLRQGDEDSLSLRAAILRKILHEAHGYRGDDKTYDDIQNANIIRVIERRKGLPVAIGILYLIVARHMGWDCAGLSFPGHFLLRMEKDGERVILDPFKEGREMNAADLRQLLKSVAGKEAELSHRFYDPVLARDVLVRLANNLKKRWIESEDYGQAIIVAEAMEAFAPDEYRIYHDKGVLYAKLGQRGQAVDALETYIRKTRDPKEKRQAEALLSEIKAQPH